ncbi:MAG: helix-turn-helix transcriptional regulator [Clostridiales bacterium]|nr:helix-turn-helix transcriptional regulator [Clostridiales bacterium]
MKKKKKKTNWEQLKTEMTALSQEDWDEIDLKVKIIGEVINARQGENLTQQALEKLCGVKQPMLARIESGDTDPQLGTILKILRPLGKTLAVVDLPPNLAGAQ